MSSLKNIKMYPLAHDVMFSESELVVRLVDGRVIQVPIIWFPRLAKADRAQLENWELLGDGDGIHWPELDEDLSVKGLLLGNRGEQNMIR